MRRGRILAAMLALSGAGIALAQSLSDDARDLQAAKRAAQAAEARAATFEAAAQRATSAAQKARAQADAVLARIEAAEADIEAAKSRVGMIEELRRRQRDRLALAQAPIVQLTAAIQTLARRPPVLALTQPGSIDDLVHVRSLLGTTLPVIAERTEGLRSELAEAERLRQSAIAAAATLADGRARLAREREQYARLEQGHLREAGVAKGSAIRESDVALQMGERARDIVDEMRDIETKSGVRQRLASLPDPMLRPVLPWETPPAPAPRPRYRLPVTGDVLTGFGDVSDSGVRARGVTLAAKPGADVTAPSGGRIVYAEPFRSYGEVVIIDHGRGFSTVVTGLASIAVSPGVTVAAGDRIGRAGTRRPRISVELRRDGRPLDVARMVAG